MKKVFLSLLLTTIFMGFGNAQKADMSELKTTEKITKKVTKTKQNATGIRIANSSSTGYWIGNPAAPAPYYSTCPYPVITDASGTLYDQGGPNAPTPSGQSQVVSVCPEGAATVDLTITYNLPDTLGLGNELVAIFDDKSRNDGLNEIANLSGTGTASYTTTGPCFSFLYQPAGSEGFQIDWSINTPGAGATFNEGDLCEDAYIITNANTPLAMSSVGSTSGPVYNSGVLVGGTSCDPDIIGDGCTTTPDNTIFAKFTSCEAGGAAILTLTPTSCNSTGQTPQMYLYSGTCGNYTFVDCVQSTAAGGSPTLNATLDSNTTYIAVIDGFRGIECDFTLDVAGCISSDCSEDAGMDGTLDICNGETEVNLPSILGGTPDAGGIWTDTDNSGVDLSNPENVDFSTVPVGTYNFTYIVQGGVPPCPNDTSVVTINLEVSGIATDFCYEVSGNTMIVFDNPTGNNTLDYFWDFGDGTTSTEENPIHTYASSNQAMTYQVCRSIIDSSGTDTCCQDVTIYPACQDNIPGPTFNYLFKNNGYIKFNNPSGVGNAYTKEWTIDGVFHSDLNQAPPKVLSPGNHRVCLTVTRNSNPNCSETFCRDIIVNNPCIVPEKIEFSYETCVSSKTFVFGSITTGTNNATTIHWDFGTGDTSLGNVAQYTFPDYGSYMVCMNVFNTGNCSKQVCGIIEVVESSCTNDCPGTNKTAKKVNQKISNKIPRREPMDELNKGTELQIIPNPASDAIQVVFGEMKSSNNTITLMDMNGKVMVETTVEKGSRNHTFNVSDLPAGVYIMTLQQPGGKKISSKLMKM